METYVRNLPLYDNLVSQATEKIAQGHVYPHKIQLVDICNQINNPTQINHLVLLLIHHYYLTNPNQNLFYDLDGRKNKNLPYGIKVSPGGRGFSVDLSLLPDLLIQIMFEYCS